MGHILKVKNLNYKSILKDCNLEIQEGSFHLISGPNKCGKTTLLKILSGVIEVSDTCFYQGKDITEMKSIAFSRCFSRVIFNGYFPFRLSNVDQEIQASLDQVNFSVSERKMKYKNLVRLFGIQGILFESIDSLSFYEKMKLLILCSVVKTPKLLFLDNVFDDLGEEEGLELIQILKRIGGMTVVVTSSNLSFAMEFDQLSIIGQSKVLLSGEALTVLKEDSMLNKLGLSLPFMVDLSLKLQYYELLDDVVLDMNRMVNKLWK